MARANHRKITIRIREEDYQLARKYAKKRGGGHNRLLREWISSQADKLRRELLQKMEITQEDL